MTTSDRVIVVGGGFAGVAAACRLAGDGLRPVLLERAPRLGGRAASFRDPTIDEDIDYGHHVTMRCCTATCGLLQRIGATSSVRYQSELRVPILCHGRRSELRSNLLLPGPFHLAPGLLSYRCLSVRQRLSVGRVVTSMMLGRARDVSFGSWLREHGQRAGTIARLWDPICIAALNAHVDDVSLPAARQVLRDGFLSPDGAGLGFFTTPLARIFDAAADYVHARDGEVRTSAGVRHLLTRAGAVRGVELASGERLEADAVVAALPAWEITRLIDEPALRTTLDTACRLAWAPIVNVHVWIDRPALGGDFLMAVDSPVQAVFDVAKIHGTCEHHLVISQSAASPWVDRTSDEIALALIAELGRLVPSVGEARVLRRLVIKHHRATFVPSPGFEALRPSAKSPVGGLYLAGDWTSTGWPSTIEGAVRSGVAAAGRAAVDFGGADPPPDEPA